MIRYVGLPEAGAFKENGRAIQIQGISRVKAVSRFTSQLSRAFTLDSDKSPWIQRKRGSPDASYQFDTTSRKDGAMRYEWAERIDGCLVMLEPSGYYQELVTCSYLIATPSGDG